ncbi:hypothetical protein EDD11_010028 [Mortierella claussenii]|nr:hypothetical protein EDD11_010028 [Mortierella claussenii]
MKLSKASMFLALCATSLLIAMPTGVQGQSSEKLPHTTTEPTKSVTTPPVTTTPFTSTSTTITTTTADSTTAQPVPSTTTVHTSAQRSTTTTVTTGGSQLPISTTAAPTSSAVIPPTGGANDTCMNSLTCPTNYVCSASSANTTLGVCIFSSFVCQSSPPQTCQTSADCPLAFSLCKLYNGTNICTGMGIPGTANECKQPPGTSGLMTTVKYAGIAVGCAAALGVAFALVRWQRRRQRSGIPAEMFGAIDYGMTDRSGSSKPMESYPFSSRPNAHGGDHAPSPLDYNNNSNSGGGGGYDNYYEEPVGYTNNMHSAKMQQDQYYDHDQYDHNQYGSGGGGDGYGGHIGGYGGSAHGGQGDGFYDNAGYDDYQHQHPTSPAPVARAVSPRHQFNAMDNYGAEPSELDFGGHGHGHGNGHGGYGGGRY